MSVQTSRLWEPIPLARKQKDTKQQLNRKPRYTSVPCFAGSNYSKTQLNLETRLGIGKEKIIKFLAWLVHQKHYTVFELQDGLPNMNYVACQNKWISFSNSKEKPTLLINPNENYPLAIKKIQHNLRLDYQITEAHMKNFHDHAEKTHLSIEDAWASYIKEVAKFRMSEIIGKNISDQMFNDYCRKHNTSSEEIFYANKFDRNLCSTMRDQCINNQNQQDIDTLRTWLKNNYFTSTHESTIQLFLNQIQKDPNYTNLEDYLNTTDKASILVKLKDIQINDLIKDYRSLTDFCTDNSPNNKTTEWLMKKIKSYNQKKIDELHKKIKQGQNRTSDWLNFVQNILAQPDEEVTKNNILNLINSNSSISLGTQRSNHRKLSEDDSHQKQIEPTNSTHRENGKGKMNNQTLLFGLIPDPFSCSTKRTQEHSHENNQVWDWFTQLFNLND